MDLNIRRSPLWSTGTSNQRISKYEVLDLEQFETRNKYWNSITNKFWFYTILGERTATPVTRS